ncbi:FH18 [Symbiodinium sp. CCMP2592]|nr:FH18 [Symbiodinium sp. CCMP2592]
MVNWQPIRQTSRIQGSVWQQVHDSLQGGAAQLPEDLLGRFMRKASEVPKKSLEQKKSAGTKRLLPSKQGLVADIHHALLTRKGIRNVRDLKWIIGPMDGEAETQEDDVEDALSEDRRLALLVGLGLLGSLPLSDVRNVPRHSGTIAFVSGRLGSCASPKLLSPARPRTACHTSAESPKQSADSKGQGRVKVTPLWVLKITQMLLFGANVCLTRFITVYYHDLGLSRKVMGLLLVMVPMMAFVGGFFWSSIVDRSGSYRRILTFTSSLGIATVFSYMLPAVGRSLPLLVLVTLLQGFVTAPAGPIVDGLCLKVLAQRSEEGSSEAYGDQRLWSAVGWGAMALIAGKLIDIFGTNAIFLSYGILVGLNVLVVQLFVQDMPAGVGGHQGSSGTKMSTREWLADLARFEPIWMLINLLVYGLLTSLVENYLNVFLVQDFDNVPRVILGAATAVMCSFEIPVFKYIGDLWSKRGYSLVSVLWASEFVMVLRCLLYASLPRSRPWLVLLVEPLHGLTFAGVWTATVEYARRLARTGTETKMQALISGVYFNVAFAIGSLIWGFISQLPPAGLGFRRSFLLDAAVGSVWLILWAAVYRLELLEALLGLLGAAVGEERCLTAAGQSLKDGVQSEIFLRQILQSVPLQELQCRVQLCLDIARFPLKAADLESGLDLALSAAWSILDSRAVPILLEGILLLGNSVNASSKNLGGAVGVTLDSLTKLAHTRCLPAKQAGNKSKKASARAESALEVLACHLDEANEGFMKNLASDLDACHAAKDFDRTLMDGLVQELATQTKQMKQSLQADTTSAQAAATSHARLGTFLEVADPKVSHLQDLLEEVDEATESLRQWFAEPSTSSLHDMLKVLSALRDMLPVAKPTAADAANRSRLYQNSETRKRRLQEKAEKATEKKAAVSLHVPETSPISRDEDLAIEATPEIVAAETQSNATVSEASEPEEAKAQAAERSAGASVTATVSEAAPSSVLAQILSFRQGTVWITWLFDWPGSVSMEGNRKFFEILQFNASEDTLDVKPEQALQRWRCQSPPFKFDVALGCHHTFAVRAMLLPSLDHSQSPEAGALWVSAMSSLVTVDLRYYSNRPQRALPSANQGGAHAAALALPAPPVVSEKTETETPSPCRGRVASSIGDFLQSLQASGGGSPPRRPSFRTDISAQTVLPGQTGSPSNLAAPTAPIAAVPSKEGVPTSTGEASPESHAAKSEIPAEKAPPEVSGDSCEKETEQLSLPFDEDALSPQSLPSRASGESWASEASLSDFDYADLSRLAQALRFPVPQSSTAGQTLQTAAGQCSVPRANSNSEQVESVEEILNSVREESLDDISKQTAQGDLKTSSSFKVPRAVSIFDQDTLDSMAEVLSNVQNIDRSQQVAGLQPSLSGELLDGEEVLAAAQRAFQKLQEKPCSACGGTGYVGLFGVAGFGIFQSKCTSCETRCRASPWTASKHLRKLPRPSERVATWQAWPLPCERSRPRICKKSLRHKQLWLRKSPYLCTKTWGTKPARPTPCCSSPSPSLRQSIRKTPCRLQKPRTTFARRSRTCDAAHSRKSWSSLSGGPVDTEKEKPADPEPEPVAVSEAEKAKVAGFDWSSTISQPAPVGGLEGYWRCERCGVLFEDPSEGARADADGNFEWFCRSCWRDWVDEHLRRARAAKEAGVSTSQHGGKGGGRALKAKPTEQRQTETKPARPLPSRQELQQLSLIELYKHARSSGADFKLLSIAMDSDNPKTGLLELLAPT